MSQKQLKKIPKLYINPDYPIFMEGVIRYIEQQECMVIIKNNVGHIMDMPMIWKKFGLIEISDDVAILLITKTSLPNEITDLGNFRNFIQVFSESYKSPIILLQGYPKCLDDKDPKILLGIRGAFMKLFLDENVGILPTRSLLDTALCLRSVAKRVQIVDNPPSLARIKPKFYSLFDAQKFFLHGLALSGPKTAENLSKNFESVEKVINGIKESSILFTRTGNPKGISGPIERVDGCSVEFIRKNHVMLFNTLNTNNKL